MNHDWTEVALTNRCNQRCFFCYEEGRDLTRELDRATIDRLLVETRKRADLVVFSGKEVLLRRDILEIVAQARSLGLRVAVFTNGQALSKPGLVDRLVEAGCRSLVVSFHFPDAAAFTVGAKSSPKGFARVLAGLANIGDFLRRNPRSGLGVSTETDMFELNAGRLAGMRQTLIDALGDCAWDMRIGSLLPSRLYDIGLARIQDPLASRRAEIAEFLATHPASLPLKFVKVPLCLLPAGHEHRSLDVEYVHGGIVHTFNHVDVQAITDDRQSTSVHRAVGPVLRAHPYRWICRACGLLPMCRYDRLDWGNPWFAPTRDQKPAPYPRSACREVLDRIGPDGKGVAAAGALLDALEAVRFPEEAMLAALGAREEGGPVLVDAWAEGAPILVAAFRHRGHEVRLHLAIPRKEAGAGAGSGAGSGTGSGAGSGTGSGAGADSAAGSAATASTAPSAVIGCAHVRPIGADDVPADVVAECLDRVEDRLIAAGCVPEPAMFEGESWLDREAASRLHAAWTRHGRGLRAGPGEDLPAAMESGDVSILFEATDRAEAGAVYRFEVAAYRADRPFYRREGGLVLSHSHASRTPGADLFEHILATVMKRVADRPLTAASLPLWQRAVAVLLDRTGLAARFAWTCRKGDIPR